VGDGSTTFNLPDMRGRIGVGLDSTQTEFDSLSDNGGAKTVTLAISDIPGHAHTIDHDHSSVVSGINSTGHTHSGTSDATQPQSGQGVGAGASAGFVTSSSLNASISNANHVPHTHTFTTGGNSVDHTHTVDLPNYTGSSNTMGGGGPHNNLQPYRVVNYIVKAL
jgi:microcystin-dependent protein